MKLRYTFDFLWGPSVVAIVDFLVVVGVDRTSLTINLASYEK